MTEGRSRETTIRRDAEGRWFHDGEAVTNQAVARAFDRWIDIGEDGRFILRNSVNWAYISVEGPALFVDRAHASPQGLTLSLSDGEDELLKGEGLVMDDEGCLYCRARDGRLEARFRRKAMLDVAPYVHEDGEGYYLEGDAFRMRIRARGWI